MCVALESNMDERNADGWYGEQFRKHGESAHNRSVKSANPSS